MTHAHADNDTFGEFAAELRALAEVLLERIEPTLRRAAADSREWDSCSWCPVCAAAALVRGEHHEVAAAVADHGTAIVTVLREALAGVPVEPLLPDDLATDAQDPADPAPGDAAASDPDDSDPVRPDADHLRDKDSRAGSGDRPGRAKRGRHAAGERPGYVPIPIRIKK